MRTRKHSHHSHHLNYLAVKQTHWALSALSLIYLEAAYDGADEHVVVADLLQQRHAHGHHDLGPHHALRRLYVDLARQLRRHLQR